MGTQEFRQKLVPTLLLLAGCLCFEGCTNKDYDMNNVDLTMGFGADSLTLPSMSTAEILLEDVLNLKENSSVTTDEAGNYVFHIEGGQAAPSHPTIDPVKLTASTYDADISINTAEILNSRRKAGKKKADSNIEVDFTSPKEKLFTYQGNDTRVKSLNSAETDETTLTLKIATSSLAPMFPTMKELSITLPSYLQFSSLTSSNGTASQSGSKITISNIVTANDITLRLKTHKLDFDKQDEYGSLTIKDGAINLEGLFSLGIKATATGYVENPTVKVSIAVGNTIVRKAEGTFSPTIDLHTLGEVAVTGIPDFLNDDKVEVDLNNPQLIIHLSNDMDIDGKVSGTVVSTKDNQTIATVTLPEMTVNRNGTTDICVCRQKTQDLIATYGEANVYEVSNLSSLIERIPDHIAITHVQAQADITKKGSIEFGHSYTIQPSYEVNAPLAFGEKATIVYTDSLTGWADDLEDVDLMDGTYFVVTADVENRIPTYLTISAHPVDKQGQDMSDLLTIEIPQTVAASPDGSTAVTTPITMKVTAKESDVFKKLDGLVYRLEGAAKADGQSAITGVTLNAKKQTLKLSNIKVKMVGKVIGDFN